MSEHDIDAFLGAAPRRRVNHWLALGALAAAAAAAFVLLVRFYNGPDQPWYTAPIERADLTPLLTVDGTAQAAGEITVRAAQDGVVRWAIAPGDALVAAGAPVAMLDPASARDDAAAAAADATAAQAQLDAAQAEAAEAHGRLARFADVWQRSSGRVPAVDEMEGARAAVTRAEAAVAAATAAVQTARLARAAAQARMAGVVARAPVAGYAVARGAVPGQPVSLGAPLVTLAPSLDRLVLHVGMSTAEAIRISPLARARVLVGWLPEAGRTASLAHIDPGGPGGADRDVTYALDGGAGPLRPGMAVRLEIPMPVRAHVLVVPNAALAAAPGGGSLDNGRAQGNGAVFVLGEDRQPRAVPVSVGGTDGTRTEVSGLGLAPGMEVITGARMATALPPGAAPVVGPIPVRAGPMPPPAAAPAGRAAAPPDISPGTKRR